MNERAANELRSIQIHPGFTEMAAGSALICAGRTRVLCTASVQEGEPPILRHTCPGSQTAENNADIAGGVLENILRRIHEPKKGICPDRT